MCVRSLVDLPRSGGAERSEDCVESLMTDSRGEGGLVKLPGRWQVIDDAAKRTEPEVTW